MDLPVNPFAEPALAPWPAGFQAASRAYVVPTMSRPLDIGRVAKWGGAIIALLLLNLGGNAGAAAFFLILLAMVVRSPASAYKALAICYLGLMINQAFVPKSIVWTPSRIAIPFVALVRFSFDLSQIHASLLTKKSYLALLLFVLTMAVCSLLSGWFTIIALLKLLNFWSCITAILAGTLVIRLRKIDISEWIVSLILAANAFGVGAILLGEGYNFLRSRTAAIATTTDLFNGAFLHPNCHALYASLFVLFLASIYVLGPYRNRWLVIPMIALWVGFMILSKSRTATLATVVPLGVLMFYARPRMNRRGFRLRANVSQRTILAAVSCLALIGVIYDFAAHGAVTKSLVTFFNKGKTSESMSLDSNQMLQSRRALIDYSWHNFMEQPLHGIGFQVAKTDFFMQNATLFSAPAEKGFLPTAVLEEGGILGASAFVILLVCLLGGWIRERNVPAIVAFMGFLITNLGEVSIFSPGGSGAFGWIMVGAASILGDHCWRRPLETQPHAFRPHAQARMT